jgi:Eco47II restriction endonuclease
MLRTHLPFIDDLKLEQIVDDTLRVAQEARAKPLTDLDRNVIDPFSTIFELFGFNLSVAQWTGNEKLRQDQKTLTNQIGAFHQKILGSTDGWTDTGNSGGLVDIVNATRRLVAEVKNKHNTVTGTHLKDLYDALDSQVMTKGNHYNGFTAYYVVVIPKGGKRFDKPFVPSDRTRTSQKRQSNELIRIIDGWSFYELATGTPNALALLYDALPNVLQRNAAKKITHDVKRFFDAAYVAKPKAPRKTKASK